MPAPGKYPDELKNRAIRLTPGRPGRPGPAWGCGVLGGGVLVVGEEEQAVGGVGGVSRRRA